MDPTFATRRFVAPVDVDTMVFDWGVIKWLSERYE
jgi:hypothetical protein